MWVEWEGTERRGDREKREKRDERVSKMGVVREGRARENEK